MGISDPKITALGNVQLQLMIQFFATRNPEIDVNFCKQPPTEYTEQEIKQILQETHNETVGHLGAQRILKLFKRNINGTTC